MIRKILDKIPDEGLKQDLKKYQQQAIELGATEAKIITTDLIVIDERIQAKCIYPKCTSYGTNANCPPYAMSLGMVRKIVNKFRYALFTRLEVPSEQVAGPVARDKRLTVRSQLKNQEIVSKIEGEAFYDGYHLALGFADGPCKRAFCPETECTALVPGRPCRHPLRARSSMEAVGMDVFKMAVNVGWNIYPIGQSLSPSKVPYGAKLGLVLIH